jgi:hypothetical protein
MNLIGADFENANIWGGDFSSADVKGVNWKGVIFEPSALPPIERIAQSRNLDNLSFSYSPSKVIELREAFSKYGYRKQEREVIAALNRHGENWLENIFFDLTCEYGSNLARPWELFLGIWFSCAVVYYLFMLNDKARSGIRIFEDLPYEKLVKLYPAFVERHGERSVKSLVHAVNPFMEDIAFFGFRKIPLRARLVWWALFFSSISSFNLGFRDINFGRWLRRMTRREFDLQPFGWVRLLSGFQALLSVYLIALWLLSFSGMPFK